jgi:DNA-binding NarL/FixJ family response regulator
MHRIARGVESMELESAGNRWIVFVGDRFSNCSSLLRAVENEFPAFEVVFVDDVDLILEEHMLPWRGAKLVVIDGKTFHTSRHRHMELRGRFGDVVVAVAYDDRAKHAGEIADFLECGLVRGLLPMNLQLDIWLSAIRLMLNGGDYMPIEFFGRSDKSAPVTASAAASADLLALDRLAPGDKSEVNGRLGGLTDRELDVLRLAAQGYQNKIIAAKLGISEHTIKLHMHHIISKLGAHNRTEAAAAFLQGHSGNTG